MNRQPCSIGLFTDLYQLTMAQAYWQSGQTGSAIFSLFFRKYPKHRAYFVAAGLGDVLDYLEDFRFTVGDLDYLRSLRKFDEGFLAHLREVRFTGSVRAMREGTLFFANEPVIEVTAPVIEGQLAETYVVNQIHLQTVLATKASRVRHAARDRTIFDFAARRAHGTDAANKLARVSYLAGYEGTSNTLAGAAYGIPVFGTMAHSFVTSFDQEVESFRAYARSFPDDSTFLVDTYDTLEGTKKAIEVALEMKQHGHMLRAIRLDSGDLAELAVQTRSLLDAAGLGEVKIFASGGLDEFAVDDLLSAGAPIDGLGVGTRAGVSADAPYGDCAYKLVEYDGKPVLKLSEGKATLPGPKQVFRIRSRDGFEHDILACASEPTPENGSALLEDVMRQGKRLRPDPSLQESRTFFQQQWQALPDPHKKLEDPAHYPVHLSAKLTELQEEVVQATKERELKT